MGNQHLKPHLPRIRGQSAFEASFTYDLTGSAAGSSYPIKTVARGLAL